MKHSPVEEILYVPLSQEEAIEDIGYAKLFEETKEAAEDYKEMKFDKEKPSATKEPLEILPKETSKQMACESNTSFKGSRVVETRKESDFRKRGPEENEEREDQIYVFERVVGDTVGVNKSTVSRVVANVSLALVARQQEYVKWPRQQ